MPGRGVTSDRTTVLLILGAIGVALYYAYRQSLDSSVVLPGSGSGAGPVSATATNTSTAIAPAPTFDTMAPGTTIADLIQSAYNSVFPMQISDAGIQFIKQEEGLSLTSYPDAGGFSVGYGHYITTADYTNYGLPQEAGVGITQELADQLFNDDILKIENTINQNVGVVLTQNQFDAIADFVYNVGSSAFLTSTLLRDLNAGNYAGAADQFRLWNKSQGQVKTSLTTRRLAEASLFQTA